MVYLVKATTGEYEDYSEQIIGYFENEEDANDLVETLKEEYKDCLKIGPEGYENYCSDSYFKNKSYKIYIDYSGVSFKVVPIKNLKD